LQLMDVANEAAALLEDLADEKHQRLTVEGDSSASILADRLILRHAVMNVIDNSVKYSPIGSPINVRVERSELRCILDVIDRGPGIPAEDREKIFDRFYRVDKARSREAGGAGLGLSIARWAVEVHGGTLRILPGTDGGSTFRFTLPAVDSVSQAASQGTGRIVSFQTVVNQRSKGQAERSSTQ